MTEDSLQNEIARFITKELRRVSDGQALGVDDELFSGGILDSVGVMRLIAHLEELLGVRIPPTGLVPQNFLTIRVMARYLLGLTDGG